MKKLVYTLLLLLVGMLVGLVVVITVIDPNEYRDEIRDAVKRETGRELDIRGDLGLSFFPWIGLEVGELELSNAPGFAEQPFAAVQKVQIRVQLLPLFSRELRIDTIRLDGATLALARDAAGRGNWEDLASGEPSDAEPQPSQPTTSEADDTPPLAALAIGGLHIVDAKVSLDDQQAGTDLRLDQVNLEVGAVLPGERFPLDFSARYSSDSQGLNALLGLAGEVTVAEDLQRIAIDGLALNLDANGSAVPGGEQQLKLGADVALDLAAQTLAISALQGDAAGVPLSGLIDVEQLLGTPQASGRLDIAEFNARELMQRLALPALESADSQALSRISAGFNFSASAQRAALSELAIGLDGSTLGGQVTVTDYSAPGLAFALTLDAIDVDRYLPPKADPAAAPAAAAAPSEAAGDPDSVPIALPVELLRQLYLDGRLRIGKLKAAGIRSTDIELPLKARDGVISMPGIIANLYQGSVRKQVRLDVRGQQPAFSAAAKLAGVHLGPLLKDATGDDLLSGQGNIDLDLNSRGDTVGALKKALDGTLAVALRDGSVKGFNVGYELRRAEAKLKGDDFSEEASSASTDFASLSVSAVINDGLLRSDDLDMRSPLLRLGGAGEVDLPKSFVDYKARVLITDTTKGQGGKARTDLAGLKMTVPIRGHFDELSADFVGAVTSAISDRAKGKLKAKQDALKQELRAKQDAEKARLKAAEDEAKQKAKDKLKDKLKGLLD